MDDIIIDRSILLPETAVRYSFSRSGGKGGQNVNKVSTKVEMHVDLHQLRCAPKVKARILERLSHRMDASGILTITSQESRSQWQNRQRAIEKLIEIITAAAVQEKYRVATKPTRASKVRRVDGKKVDSRKKLLRRPPNRSADE